MGSNDLLCLKMLSKVWRIAPVTFMTPSRYSKKKEQMPGLVKQVTIPSQNRCTQSYQIQ